MPLYDRYIPSQAFPRGGEVLNSMGGRLPGADWFRLRQPYLDSRGRACVAIRDLKGGFTANDSRGGEKKPLLRSYLINELMQMGYPVPVLANAATLRKEEWIELERRVVLSARQRLQAVTDLENASPFGGVDAMGAMTLEYQAMSDPGAAYVDMDGLTDGTTDTAQFITRSLPLPITHSDFGYSDRELTVSQRTGVGLDDIGAEAAGRRIGESLEDQLIGNVAGVTYATQTAGPGTHTGTSTVYGYRTFAARLTKTNFTAPTSTNGSTTYNEVLAALNQLYAQFFYGPFVLYHSTDWSQYMDTPFSTSGGNHPSETLRTMLMKIPAISDVRRLDRLTATYTLLFVQMSPEVAQLVNAMDLRTIQWDEKGGLAHRWKTMACKVPRLRSDYSSRTGILHGTTA